VLAFTTRKSYRAASTPFMAPRVAEKTSACVGVGVGASTESWRDASLRSLSVGRRDASSVTVTPSPSLLPAVNVIWEEDGSLRERDTRIVVETAPAMTINFVMTDMAPPVTPLAQRAFT